jgi:excisionase family DNA binding protein
MDEFMQDIVKLPSILKTVEVAGILRISPRMVQLLAKDGRLASVQIANIRGYRFRKEDVLEFIERNTKATFTPE